MDAPEEIDARKIEAIKNEFNIQTNTEQHSSSIKKDHVPTLGLSAIILACFGIIYFLLEWNYLPVPEFYIPLVQKIVVATMLIALVITINRIIKKVLTKRIENKSTVFNLNRVANLFASLIVVGIILSLLFANWYATMVSFGIVSLILGLALQNPITSFFGWIYILVRKPYEVGDRIKIGGAFGDVINVSYFDTTLWEFNGDYLSGDHPSGRIIKFANSRIFNEYVYNYSWPLFPFIWNEVKVFVAMDSDLNFAGELVKKVVEQEVGEAMVRRVGRFKNILKDTPVDEFDVSERPTIIWRIHDNVWVQIIARYLVEPKKSGPVQSQLSKLLMDELKKHPDKIRIPNTNPQ